MQLATWTIDDLSTRCLDGHAFHVLARKAGLSARRAVIYERACLLTSLGMHPSRVLRYLTCRDEAQHSVSTGAFVAKLTYLLQDLAIPRRRVCGMLARNPRLLDYSLQRTMRPRAEFFQQYLALPDLAAVGKCVVRSPRLLWVRPPLPPASHARAEDSAPRQYWGDPHRPGGAQHGQACR